MEFLHKLPENAFLAFVLLTFIAIVLLLEAVFFAWNDGNSPEVRRVKGRLRALAAGARADGHTPLLKRRLVSATPITDRLLLAIPHVRNLDRFLEQSGLPWSAGSLLFLAIGLGVAGYFLGRLFFTTFLAPVVAVACLSLPFAFVQLRRTRRLERIGWQLPDAIDLIGRGMRAGHAFSTGLKMVAEEMADPIAAEFRIVHDEVNYGVSIQQAMGNLAARVPTSDMRYFVVAVLIQRDTGGNLTEVLDKLSKLIRERLKLFQKIHALTAEGRMSAWILGILPFALAAILHAINPGFIGILWTDPGGLKLVQEALLVMAAGVFWMRTIIHIHV